ncbi:hypothetical protein EV421DRAFT_1738437 [Armillaria borealis]|uniref:Uncharacterized protein n=1 Tax=Armillaria borealis TaxID=47425 RepID=A0AA39MLK9_9AGAR|nr:hypothetical protein EV421DRAFT_1738437 [Armillaria borealis]
MQITPDFSTCTLATLTASILGVTSLLTIFLLYWTYKYEIGRYIRRLFEYAPRFPTYSFYPHPYLQRLISPNEWNTPGPSDWDTLPTLTIRSGTLPWIDLSMSSGSISTAVPISDVAHIPDVVREDDVSSQGTDSGPAEFTPRTRPQSSDGNAESSNPPPREFTPIPYNLTVNPEPYSQEHSPAPTNYTHEPSPVPMVHIWHVTNGIPGGTSPLPSTSGSSNGSG